MAADAATGAGSTGPEVVPRWEWRTFGEVEPAERALAPYSPDSVHDSDEVYVLSVGSDASVKVRDELMDVKRLLQVDGDGLELWRPVMKAAFPLAAPDAATMLAALDVDDVELAKASYAPQELLADVIDPDPRLLAARVHKRRVRYVIDECMVELTDIRADHTSTQTVAVESPDPALVTSTVERLGLGGRRNTCVARGLKLLLGFGRFAVIDVGTNSVKFHVGERRADGQIVRVVDRAEVTRLGEGQVSSGVLAQEPIDRTIDAIAGMVDEARSEGVLDISAVGTAGLRLAPNRSDLVDRVRDRCGITVEVISGEEEARLAYVAATSSLPSARGRLVVFDSGGGSTQLTFGEDSQVEERFSVDVGAVRVAERYGLTDAVSREAVDAALAGIAAELDRLDGRTRPDAIVAIGGTATNLAAVKHGLAQYDPDRVHGTVLELDEIDRQIEQYRIRSADERREIVGLQPARAEVILAGACIVRTVLTKLQHDAATVSDRGLRHGRLIERFA